MERVVGGLHIKPTILSGNETVDFEMWKSRGNGKFEGVETLAMSCTYDGQTIGPSSEFALSSDAETIRCTRDFSETEFDGAPVKYYPSANVTIKTNEGNQSVEFIPALDGPAQNRFETIDTNLVGLQKQIQDLQYQLQNLEFHPASNGNGAFPRPVPGCPEGWKQTAFVSVNSWKGGSRGQGGYTRLCYRLPEPPN